MEIDWQSGIACLDLVSSFSYCLHIKRQNTSFNLPFPSNLASSSVMKIFLIILVVFPSLIFSRQVSGTGPAAFFDSTAFSDAIRITMTGVSTPQTGKAYYGWLGRDTDVGFIGLGQLTVQGGSITRVFKHPNDSNLIGLAKKILISEETTPFSGTSPTLSSVVFADSLHGPGIPAPGSPLGRIRNCVVGFSNTANNFGLAIWMKKHIRDYTDHAGFARSGAVTNNIGEARSHCDHIYDFIRGKLSGFVSGNSSVAVNSDPVGYGYRRYGDLGTKDSTQGGAGALGGAGYHVKLVVNDVNATQQMKKAGGSALRALTNAFGAANDSGWAKEVADRALNIVNGVYSSGSLPTEGDPFLDLALKFINGTVGATDTASTTGGIQQAYFHMQQMASFVLNPVSVTSIEHDPRGAAPSLFELHQNFPNPFNPSTSIRFVLPVASSVRLTIHDLLGRELERIVDADQLSPGSHLYVWETDFPSGVYFVRLDILGSGSPPLIRRMILIR